MPRKLDRKVRELLIERLENNGFTQTDDVLDFIRPFYGFDYQAERERSMRRYVGQIARTQRDAQGARVMFMEKERGEIVNLDVCEDASRVDLVKSQLMIQSRGLWTSLKKAEKRKRELSGQVSMFSENMLFREMTGTDSQPEAPSRKNVSPSIPFASPPIN